MKKALILILIAGLLTGCAGKPTTPTENKEKAPAVEEKAVKPEEDKDKLKEEAKSQVEITDLVVHDDGITPTVTGFIKNKTDKEIDFVEIEFAVKDKSGKKIDSAIETTAHLKAGEKREFEGVSLSSEKEQVIDIEDYEVDVKFK